MDIVNYKNFIKFKLEDDNIYMIYGVIEYAHTYKVPLPSFIVLTNSILPNKPFNINNGSIYVDIPFLLFNLQNAMRNNKKWSFSTRKGRVSINNDKKIESYECPDHIFINMKNKTPFSDNETLIKSKVLCASLDTNYGTYSYTSKKTPCLLLKVESDVIRFFDVPKKLITKLILSISEKTGIDIILSDDYMIAFINRLCEDDLILYTDYLDYKKNDNCYAYLTYTFGIPNVDRAIYWLTGENDDNDNNDNNNKGAKGVSNSFTDCVNSFIEYVENCKDENFTTNESVLKQQLIERLKALI